MPRDCATCAPVAKNSLILSLILIAVQAAGIYLGLAGRGVQPMLLGALLASLVGFSFGAYGVVVAKRRWRIRNLVLALVAVLNGVLFAVIFMSVIG
ncbi:MAG: hypothetical protein MUO76_14730 [Anaerolineaceae bacterium]|nr:hypothetical protein [Anaerolineaceae bacterium]